MLILHVDTIKTTRGLATLAPKSV